jgi:hypothetical protein
MVGVVLVLSGGVYWTDVPLPAPEWFVPRSGRFCFMDRFIGWGGSFLVKSSYLVYGRSTLG